MPKAGRAVQEFYEQAFHIVDVYRTTDFNFDDQMDELYLEIEKALDILRKLGMGGHFTFHDIYSFFNDMDASGIINDITPEELRHRIDKGMLRSPFRYEFWFRLGNLYGFSSKFELGLGTVLRFEDLPDDVRKGFSDALEYKIRTGTARNRKPIEAGWYLAIAVKSVGRDRARQKAIAELKRCINILKFFYDWSNTTYYFDTASIIDYCVKAEDDIPKMWEGRRFSARPLERSFIAKDGSISDITSIVRKNPRTELEDRILNAIDVFGMIEESTPLHMRFILCTISFEGLLLGNKDKREGIGYSLAEKISQLVGDSREWLAMHSKIEPQTEGVVLNEEYTRVHRDEAIAALFKKAKAMYKKRSDFAHAGLNKDSISAEDFSFMSTILKWTLKKVLALRNEGYSTISRNNKPGDKPLNYYFQQLKRSQSGKR